jgi:hypothetical protein
MCAIYQCLLNLPIALYTKYFICSDSKNSLRKLQTNDDSKLDTLTAQTLFFLQHLLQSNVEITFIWIPGHCGNIGHDVVDMATKMEPEYYIPLISPISLKDHIRKCVESSWEAEWLLSLGKLRALKENITNWTRDISNHCSATRNIETTINRIFLGHTRLTHEYIFRREPPPTCSRCSERLTIAHIFSSTCNSYIRNPHINYLQLNSLPDLMTFIVTNSLTRVI